MEDAIIGLINNLEGSDALIAFFLTTFIIVLKTPETMIAKKLKGLLTKWILIAMGFSIATSFIMHIVNIFIK